MIGPRHSVQIALFVALLLLGCGKEEGARQDPIVARIDGEAVRLSEVEQRAGWRLHRARLDVYLVLERETERWIEERILERAARERDLDVESLLGRIEAEAEPVTDADVDRYLERNPSDVAVAHARPRVRHYLEQTRKIERRLDFLATLRESADIEMRLDPPTPPRSDLDLRGAPSRGAEDAPIRIVQFADLSREDSARSARQLARLAHELPGQIRILHRSLPVERDEVGLLTAQLASVAQRRGSFWALHDRLVATGGVEQEGDLKAIARELDLGDLLPGLAADRDSLLQVRRDLEYARDLGVRRAPTLFVNGRYFMGLGGDEALRALVQEELEAKSRPE